MGMKRGNKLPAVGTPEYVTTLAASVLKLPEPQQGEPSRDHNLKRKEYSSEWTFTVPADSTLGEYKALIILYEVELLSEEIVEELN
jgi:hypothetical protein